MIIVTAATAFETSLLSGWLTYARPEVIGHYEAIKGRLGRAPVLILNTGVGKTNAAHAATLLLERYTPKLLLLIGCGGAYKKSGLCAGDLAIATEEIFGDEGVITPHGWRSMRYLKLPLLREGQHVFYNRFPLDQKIVRMAKNILHGMRHKTGAFVTVSEVTGTDTRASEMERRFRGICENMEGAAVAQLCTLYGIPFLEIRGISNIVKQRNKKEWNLSDAARISQEAARRIIMDWNRTRS